jgi:hypothetical protein
MTDYSDLHIRPEESSALGMSWAQIEYMLLDPMERRHYWWEIVDGYEQGPS